MTPEAQRIAIAEACGWRTLSDGEWIGPDNHNAKGFRDDEGCWHDIPPDYLNDLNAAHEMEKVLTELDFAAYFTHLIHETNTSTGEVVGHFELIHATAAQRAQAFLMTLGLWKDK